jgi:acetylxylan esterase
MQIWHGTADNLLYPQNFFEEIKQWTNVYVFMPSCLPFAP